MEIEPGLVCGFRRTYYGVKNGQVVITLDTIGMVDPEGDGFETGDATFIEGEPNVDLVIRGEIAQKAGLATVAHAVNAIPQVMEAKPGLVTVRDLPVAAAIK
jgi:4-hydroxy-tetrahydrodipicolinate reductase